eukprot:1364876-Amorphochlora_amoeboformis.AAC.1
MHTYWGHMSHASTHRHTHTDRAEANVVNATASLATVRTALLSLFYQKPPYPSLKNFLDIFRSVDMRG